jgi:hypothetical protein
MPARVCDLYSSRSKALGADDLYRSPGCARCSGSPQESPVITVTLKK